jgi:hypothetical protein
MQPGISPSRVFGPVPMASANLVPRRCASWHAAEIFAAWQSARLQLAQCYRHLDVRPAGRHRFVRRCDVLSVGQQSCLQDDGQYAASSERPATRRRESADRRRRPAKSQPRRIRELFLRQE